MQKIRTAYFGSPDFAAKFLELMITDNDSPFEVVLVVTQPDKPVGRKQILTPSPVNTVEEKYGLETFSVSRASILQSSRIDLAVLYAYGEIIPKDILAIPKFGFWNIHPSLLPLYRGATPTTFPLLFGDKVTGVTLMEMAEKLDAGAILAQEKYEINPDSRRPDLEQDLTKQAYQVLKRTVLNSPDLSFLSRTPQDESRATFTRMISKQDGFLSLPVLQKALQNEPLTPEEIPQIAQWYISRNPSAEIKLPGSAEIVYNLYRALYPWPGLWTFFPTTNGERRLKLTELKRVNGKLELIKVQLEGKNEVDYPTFTKAYGELK
ncbi:methionyl-tRNA formyltransferase [Candidatus Roizmanbacteria bacterium]|nr:methionyl-tRNA formyltransferase [Candidatus Roizmanbacteria bacterium]